MGEKTKLNKIPVGISQNFPFKPNRDAVYINQDFFAARADPGNSKTRALGNASHRHPVTWCF